MLPLCRLAALLLLLLLGTPLFAVETFVVDGHVADWLIVAATVPGTAAGTPTGGATVLLLVSQQPDRRMEWIGALCVTMAVCAVVLLMAERIQRLVGERVVMAFERLMGLILVAISVEMLIRGIKQLAQQL